tara:strand:- start:1066 stop:1866 length:801 start_codon:yes stop_codon:yes gene_type:complete
VKIFAALVIVLASSPLSTLACEIDLRGKLIQGGLVVGRVMNYELVYYEDRAVRVSPEGVFLIGFGRDSPESALLRAGKKKCRLAIASRTYNVSRINGLPSRKVTPVKPADLRQIREDNDAINLVRRVDSASTDFADGFQWPVKGRISGVFGSQRILNGKPRRPHNGIDIAAPRGTPIHAPAPGRIALTHENMFFSGKTVMIDHGHGLISIYIHLSEIIVRKDDRINAGDTIGRVGMTGRATGPHLHWGLTWFQTHLDPQLLVGPMR